MTESNFHALNNTIQPYEYDKATFFIESYKPSIKINYLIETYLVLKLLQTEEEFSGFKSLIKQFKEDLYNNVSNSIFEIDYENIDVYYKDAFWELVLFLDRLTEVDANEFEMYVAKYKIQVINLSSSVKLVQLFPSIIKNNFLSLPSNIEYFLMHQSGKYLDSKNGLFIKLGITNSDINDLAKRYCESNLANPNYLQSIVNYKKLSQYSFTDEIKLLSKRIVEQFWEKHFESNEGISYLYGVHISPLLENQLYHFETKGLNYQIVINKNILDEHHDFPTLLNNFIYIFGLFDYEIGLPWLVLNSEHISFSSIFSSQSNADYTSFDKNLKLSHNLLFFAYFDYLKNNEIDLEEIIEWYFNIYLQEELEISDFRFNSSNKDSSYYERGKSIISEMDSILDQYELFFKYGEIDSELLAMKSSSVSYRNLNSFKEHKFLKLKNNADNSMMFSLLFSEQSNLGHIPSQEKIHTFFKNVQNGVRLADFFDYQQKNIKYLVENNVIELVGKDNIIKFKDIREIDILHKLWESGTYCTFYRNESDLCVIEKLVEKNFCEYTSGLFSEAETDYLSYILDDKKYGNGLKIRNKFSHGNFSFFGEKQHLENYLELLQIAIFYVIRINDELEYYKIKNNA